MKTIILCGGRGMRLNEETEYRPKPLVPVGNRPILWHIMRIYAGFGFREFVLCLGYRGDMIKDYFLRYDTMSNDCTVHLGQKRSVTFENSNHDQEYHITLAETGLDTLTGGRIKRIEKYIDEDTFMLTYGDGVCDVNIEELVKFHRAHGKCATLTAVHPVSRFGVLNLNSKGEIGSFAEKPVTNDWINAGFFVFNKKIFGYLSGDDCILEQGPLQRLAKEGQLMAFRHEGFFYAMDTYRDYKYLNEMWDKGQTPWMK
jgi:glucose-1-phosphate cytidylyltransferase